MPNCDTCDKKEDQTPEYVSYRAWELEMARHERSEKRHWVMHIVQAVVTAVIVAMFVWLWNQYVFESYWYEYTQDGEGINIIGDRNREVTYYGSEVESAGEGTD